LHPPEGIQPQIAGRIGYGPKGLVNYGLSSLDCDCSAANSITNGVYPHVFLGSRRLQRKSGRERGVEAAPGRQEDYAVRDGDVIHFRFNV
jgi:hypothetical protein